MPIDGTLSSQPNKVMIIIAYFQILRRVEASETRLPDWYKKRCAKDRLIRETIRERWKFSKKEGGI